MFTVTTPQVDARDVHIDWAPGASGADHYELEVLEVVKDLEHVHGTSHVIGGLEPGKTYKFRLTAIDAAGVRQDTGEAEATTVH